MNNEIKQYLKENLDISIEQIQEFGPVESIKVQIELEGEVICEDKCTLPQGYES